MGLFNWHLGRKTSEKSERREQPPVPKGLRISNVQGIGQRERQEDSFAVLNVQDRRKREEEGLFALVADGMGGMEDGREASEFVSDSMCRFFPNLYLQEDPVQALNQQVRSVSASLFENFSGRSGSTLAAAWLQGTRLHWVSVGDSGIFLMRSGGIFQMNREHSYLNDLYLQEFAESRINRKRAEENEDAHRLTSFMGMRDMPWIDQSQLPLNLQSGDTILICSDGISGVLTPPDMLEALRLEPDQGCALLEQMLEEKNVPGQDNYTGIILKYN